MLEFDILLSYIALKILIMKTIQIQQISVLELRELITEIIRKELKDFHPQLHSDKKKEVYGTRQEVAKELRISLPVLNEHTKKGTLPGYRLGGRVLYKWSEVFESLEKIKFLKYKRQTEI
jgi:excisionase family DNA binding protein